MREAIALQERTLGPHHSDLANTLNNLGVVCEMTDNPIDAEHYFRRAYTIATATLPSDHPFVATSRKNLHDFCAARGRPAELPPSPSAVAAWLEAPVPASRLEPSTPVKTREVTIPRKRSLRPLALSAISAVALLIVILTMARPWSGSLEETKSPPATATAPTASPVTAIPSTRQTPSAELPTQPARIENGSIAAKPGAVVRPAAMPTVVTAQICTALTQWRCQGAGGQVPPGPTFFFTQVKSVTATTIEHRWYHGDRMLRAVQLRIEANPGAGYRTFSRNTIGRERAGDWRVELRSADGTVLHEERFVVR